jgi:hypothetical protein
MTKLRITEADLRAMREAVENTRDQCSPENHARLTEMVDVLVELRAMVLESDAADDTPVGEEFLALATERVRARKST